MVKLTLIQGDALEVLPTLPTNSVDLIITDPPQNLSHERKIDRTKIEKRSLKRPSILSYDFGDWDKFESDEEFLNFTWSWVRECFRILKPNGSFYCFFPRQYISFLDLMVRKLGFKPRSVIVWHKLNPCPQIFKVGYMEACELILYATGKGHFYNYKLGQTHNFIETPLCQGKERLGHPNQKPEKVIEFLMVRSSREGDTVLDPFLGSGTTMKVARDLRRNCIGIEKDEKWIKVTKKRLNWGSSLGDVEFEFKVI